MIKESNGYSLQKHNTFHIDAKADKFIEYTTVGDLKRILASAEIQKTPVLHIGGGSNLLFVADFKGIILHSLIKGIEITNETDDFIYIRVGAGEIWDEFVATCVEKGWGGVENLSLIPGEVGASAVQNIGAYGAEAKDCIGKVEVVELSSGEERSLTNAECCFSYRQSIFKSEYKNKYIVTYVTFKLSRCPNYNLEYGNIKTELEKYPEINLSTIRQAVISIRRAKLPDPEVEGNAGSFFMNPVVTAEKFESLYKEYPEIPHYDAGTGLIKLPAAWLIDQCGWKGRTVGHAGVHDKQALVLVNRGGATGSEIVELSEMIRTSVKNKFGVEIHPEVNFIG